MLSYTSHCFLSNDFEHTCLLKVLGQDVLTNQAEAYAIEAHILGGVMNPPTCLSRDNRTP